MEVKRSGRLPNNHYWSVGEKLGKAWNIGKKLKNKSVG